MNLKKETIELQQSFSKVIKSSIRSVLYEELNTGLPAEITEVTDFKKRKCQVKPLVKIRYLDGNIVTLPKIENVPVMYHGNESSLLKTPLEVGTKVWLSFSQRSLDTWLSRGNDSEPGQDNQKFALKDAVAHIGLTDFSKDHPLINNNDDLEMIYNDTKIIIKKNGDIELDGGNKIIVKSNGDIELGTSGLSKLVKNNILADFNKHIHLAPSGVTAGPLDPVGPTPIVWTDLVNATQKVSGE
jgi:hypothetical protein